MNKIQKLKKSYAIINKIEKIRSKNNINWMNLVRLAIKLDQKSTSKILYQIHKTDKSISKLAEKLYKI